MLSFSPFVRQLQHPRVNRWISRYTNELEFSQKALQRGVLANLISECIDNQAIIDMDKRWRREGIAASYML
jgi:hypothetical protein